MDCEVCGRSDAGIMAVVEGVQMRICDKCAKYASRIVYREPAEAEAGVKDAMKPPVKELEVVEDFAQRIKAARERKGLTRKEFAAMINEKESYLRRIEDGDLTPDDVLLRKIGKALGIELLVETHVEAPKVERRKAASVTLGDIVELVKKKFRK